MYQFINDTIRDQNTNYKISTSNTQCIFIIIISDKICSKDRIQWDITRRMKSSQTLTRLYFELMTNGLTIRLGSI